MTTAKVDGRRGSQASPAGYLLDTNICVYLVNAQYKEPSRRTREEARVWERFGSEEAPLFTSEVSLGELVFGAERSAHPEKNLARIEVFFELAPPLAVTRDTWRLFGITKAQLQARGASIADLDLLIACAARIHELTLVSNDQAFASLPAEFYRENWAG